jgi:sodium-dependent dicarboxylate transporter 2/3/5
LIGIVLGPTVLLVVVNLPLDMTVQQQNLLGLVAMTLVFWVLRVFPIALTPVITLGLAVILNVASDREAFSAFSSPTLFLLIGSFILTHAMTRHGLGRRISLAVLSLPTVASSTYRIVIAFGALAALMSTVLDNGAVAAILLPIAISLSKTFADDIEAQSGVSDDTHPLAFTVALMLMTAYGSTVGALLTPLGDASNLVGWAHMQRYNDVEITIGLWVAVAAPIVIVLFCTLCAIVLAFNRPEVGSIRGAQATVAAHRASLGPMTRAEKNTVLWLLPSLAGLIYGSGSEVHRLVTDRLPPSVVAILAAAALFLLPVGWQKGFTLKWDDARNTNWEPILLVGATLALGSLMGSTGLAEEVGGRLAGYAENFSAVGVYAFAAGLATAFSELTTNLVSVTVLVPIIPAVAEAAGGDSLQATWTATFAAIYGFMLPISTSANAIVYGSGLIPFWKMVKTGLFVDVSGVILVAVGVHVMLRVLGVVG